MKKEKIEADKNNVLEAYRNAGANGRQSLEKVFGKDIFIQKSSDWMKLGIDFCNKNKAPIILPYPKPKTPDEEWHNSAEILRCVVRIKIGDWTPDWSDVSQEKWYPYFKMSPFGFTTTHCGTWLTFATVGSRLCFPTSKMAEETAKEFLAIYEFFYKY